MGSNFCDRVRYTFLSSGAIRVPLLPAVLYQHLSAPTEANHDLIEVAAVKAGLPKEFLEIAIRRASPDLLSEHKRNPSSKTRASIARYLLRMCSRATPFGMFSASAYFDWSDDLAETFTLLDPTMCLFSSPAQEYKSIVASQSDIEVLKDAMLFRSPSCREIAGRLYCEVETAECCTQQSVRMTPLVSELYAQLKAPQRSSCLALLISERLNIDQSRILQTIAVLISKGFLNTSKVRDFLQSREPKRPVQTWNIRNNVKETLSLTKEGEDAYICLTSFGISGSLAPQIAKDAAVLAEILLRVNGPDQLNSSYAAYKREFIERYGSRQPVGLQNIIDTSCGIGLPSDIQSGPLADSPRRARALSEIIAQGLKSDGIVECNEELISALTDGEERQDPDSLDIVVTVIAESLHAVNSGKYFLQPAGNPGCVGAGRHVARFAVLDRSHSTRFEEAINTNHKLLTPYALQCELNCVPLKARLLNVMAGSPVYDVVVSDFSGPKNISIGEVGLISDGDRLRIISLATGQDLNIHVNNMINARLIPRAYRALLELQGGRVRRLRRFDWGPFSNAEILPRLVYKKVIISPKRWHPPADRFSTDLDIHGWRQKFAVSEFISVGSDDNRLILNLNKPSHISEFLRLARRTSGRLWLEEASDPLNIAWIKSNIGRHVGEVVVSLVRHEDAPSQTRIPSVLPLAGHQHPIKTFSPGSEWLFFKVYSARWLEDRLIGESICDLLGRCSSQIERWFFIRYAHPRPHLRLRLRVKDAQLASVFLTSTQILERAKSSELCSEFNVDTYQPEYARFGGPLHYQKAEEFFEMDSRCVLRMISDAQPMNKRQLLGVTMTAAVFRELGINHADAASYFFRLSKRSKRGGEVFRQIKREIRAAVFNQANVHTHTHGILNDYERELALHFADSQSWAALLRSSPQILGDILHLQCNRLFGTDRQEESLHFELLDRAYDSLNKFTLNP